MGREREEPAPVGAKEPFCFARPAPGRSLSPRSGAGQIWRQVPSANALGYYLAPLLGLASAGLAAPSETRASFPKTRDASTFMSRPRWPAQRRSVMSCLLRSVDRLLQLPDNIFHVLDPYRDPHQILAHSRFHLLLIG